MFNHHLSKRFVIVLSPTKKQPNANQCQMHFFVKRLSLGLVLVGRKMNIYLSQNYFDAGYKKKNQIRKMLC